MTSVPSERKTRSDPGATAVESDTAQTLLMKEGPDSAASRAIGWAAAGAGFGGCAFFLQGGSARTATQQMTRGRASMSSLRRRIQCTRGLRSRQPRAVPLHGELT